MKFVTYLRVSTAKQGRSGLGLDAQRKMCDDFIRAHGGTHSKEFCDVESGTHRDRKGLQDAINYCKASGHPLVIAKLDRLARDVEFCFRVVNTGIEIHFCDMPQMNTLLLGVFASVAQYERELTSERTKKALEVKKNQGALLGAANKTYKSNRLKKKVEEIEMENRRRGMTKRARHQESRDVQTFLRVLRNVFNCNDQDPTQWDWSVINTKGENKDKILSSMKDYSEFDQNVFRNWDFNVDNSQKLRSYIQSVRRSFIN